MRSAVISTVSPAHADAPAAEVAAPKDTHLYLLPKPVPVDVQIGSLGKALHYSYWALEILVKTGFSYAATHHIAPTIGFFMFTLAHSAPYITGHSMIDVKVREKLKSSWMVRKLRDIPNLKRAVLFSSGQLKFDGPLVRGRESQNYVFVETTEPLDVSKDSEYMILFGRPIEVTDPSAAKMRFALTIDGKANAAIWEAPLADVLAGEAIPGEIANAWRNEVKEWDKSSKEWSEEAAAKYPRLSKKLPSLDYLLGKHNRAVQVDVHLSLPTGEELPIPSFIAGGQVRKLLGMSMLQRVKDFFVDRLQNGDLVERSVPLDVKNFPVKKCERILTEGMLENFPKIDPHL